MTLPHVISRFLKLMQIRLEERGEQTCLIICGRKKHAVNTIQNICEEGGQGYIASFDCDNKLTDTILFLRSFFLPF